MTYDWQAGLALLLFGAWALVFAFRVWRIKRILRDDKTNSS